MESLLLDVCDTNTFSDSNVKEAIAIRRDINAIFAATMANVAGGGGCIQGRGEDKEISHTTT